MPPQVQASSDTPEATVVPLKQPSTSIIEPQAAAASAGPASSTPSSAAPSLTTQSKPIAAASEKPEATGVICCWVYYLKLVA